MESVIKFLSVLTYADLKQERQHVIQALMEMDCIPAGMELISSG